MLFFVHFLYFPWKNIIVCIFYISSTICPCAPGNAITYTPVDRGTPLHLHPVDRGTSLHMPLTYSAYVTKASSDMTQSYTVVKSGRCCTPLSRRVSSGCSADMQCKWWEFFSVRVDLQASAVMNLLHSLLHLLRFIKTYCYQSNFKEHYALRSITVIMLSEI